MTNQAQLRRVTIPPMRAPAFALTLILAAAPALAQTAPAPATAPAAKAPKPTSLREVLLAQLRSTHNNEDWFVPVNVAVAGLTPEQARWIPKSNGPNNPAPADHSVGMLTNHLLYWNARSLAAMTHKDPGPLPGDNTETFNKFDASTWPATAQRLDQVLTQLEDLVAHADDAQLAQMADGIAHISAHNAYHVGQIIEVRKLQGTWDPAKGVK
jgi:hypothetical protein